MAAKKDKYDKLHDKELAALLRELDAIYADLANEIGSIGATYASSVDKTIPFVLSKYPLIQKRVDAVLKKLAKRVKSSVVNGVKSVWTLANQKNNELCRLVFGAMLGQLTKEQERKYYTSNDAALQAFLQRKVKGMNLSDRVWNYSEMCRTQIEATLELGIKTGESAAEMATDLKTYLKYPDKLFRRVRGADGNLHLSKAAAQFHPGQGVYRSSYQNAYRLARTETNMAYRSADYLRRTQLDFVVGIEIHLSNNHTCLGRDGKPHPFTDICDELQGKYPKWFDFKGWHPACRCFTTSILKTDEEIERDMDGIDRGSVNEVKDMPPQWTKWLEKNRERVDMAAALGRLPYFLRDNPWAWQEGVEPPWVEYQKAQQQAQQQQSQKQTILQKAQARHEARTPEQIADIKRRWNERQIAYNDAKMVLKLVDSVPDLKGYVMVDPDYLDMVERVRKMYETGRGYDSFGAMRIEIYEVMKGLKHMRDNLSSLADPFKAMQDFGLEKAVAANDAVKSKLDYFDSHGDLDWKIKKLKFEIDWLDKPENQKYSTWKVAQDAYKKALEEAERQKFWYDFQSGTGDSVGYYMGVARVKYPDLHGRMRVAYKSKDKSTMIDLIIEFKEEEKWEDNRNKFESIKNNSAAQLLQQNNDKYTFIDDMEAAIAGRQPLAFKKAYNAAVQAVGEYQGLQSVAAEVIDKLMLHNEDIAAAALTKASVNAKVDDMERLIKEGQWLVEWAERKEEYQSYRTNIAAAELDEKNKFGYLDAMKKAIDDQEEYPYNEARKKLDAAISKFNGYVNDAIKLIARLNNVGENKAALDLERVVDEYVLTDIVKALQEAEKKAKWAELMKRADTVLKKENREILTKLGHESFISAAETFIQQHDAGWLNAALKEAEKALQEWKDLVDKASDLNYNYSLPSAIDDALGDAIDNIDEPALEAAIHRAEQYVKIFIPLKKELDDIEPKKKELAQKLADQKAELKKKRAEIAQQRKYITAEANRIKAMYPAWDEKDLKLYSSEWKENEKKRAAMNAAAKKLRDSEAKLTDIESKFEKWDDLVDLGRISIDNEDAKNAKLASDALNGIANDINNLGQDEDLTVDPNALRFLNNGKTFSDWLDIDFDYANELFKKMTVEERHNIIEYTRGSGKYNRPLRGYRGQWGDSNFKGLGKVPFDYEGAPSDGYTKITDTLSRAKTKRPMWVSRGSDFDSFKGVFGFDLRGMTEGDAKKKIGAEGRDEAFVSTSPTNPWPANILYNIYLPAGSEAMTIAPFSWYGGSSHSYDGENWTELNRHRSMGEEEILVNRGYRFRIIDIKRCSRGSWTWEVDMYAVSRDGNYYDSQTP